MKILHLINTLSAGGAELHLLTLCRHLKRKNVEIVVACLREHVKDSRSLRYDFEAEGIRVIRLQADSRYSSLFLSQITKVLKQEHPDILLNNCAVVCRSGRLKIGRMSFRPSMRIRKLADE